MAIWYEVEKNKQGIDNFLECNWSFHDFTIDRLEYYRKDNLVELFLKYDDFKDSVILRFIGIQGMNIVIPDGDYDAYLTGSTLVLSNDNSFTWLAAEVGADEIEITKKYTTWLQANMIIWAVTDENGDPTELPHSKIDQIWHVYGKTEEHHFSLKKFTGNPHLTRKLSLTK